MKRSSSAAPAPRRRSLRRGRPLDGSAQYSDYTRRVIIYSNQQFSPERFDSVLAPYQPVETAKFDMDEIHVRVLFLQNHERSVGDAIQTLQERFADYSFERDVRLDVLQFAFNDPLYPEQWAPQKIELGAAWERLSQINPRAVTVAIADWGVQRTHQDLDQAANMIVGTRVIPPNTNDFSDDSGHGTMLAGIIAAVSNNNLGIAGTAPGVVLMAIKFIDQRTPPTMSAAAQAISYAVNNNAQVIVASWHVGIDTGLLRQAIQFAGNHGVLVVAAAGNSGSDNSRTPFFPASYAYDNMISVMASDEHDDKPGFSNYGDNVDLAAPGTRILSTSIYLRPPPTPTPVPPPYRYNPAYRLFSGTSPAAAFVSGAAALLLNMDNWTPHEIREHLVASADPVRDLWGICRANGRLNLRRAVLGPFSIVKPSGGEHLQRGTLYDVHWHSEYNSPVVNTVAISINGVLLTPPGGIPNTGQYRVTLPNQAMLHAVLRVQCVQKNLYAESRQFRIM